MKCVKGKYAPLCNKMYFGLRHDILYCTSFLIKTTTIHIFKAYSVTLGPFYEATPFADLYFDNDIEGMLILLHFLFLIIQVNMMLVNINQHYNPLFESI